MATKNKSKKTDTTSVHVKNTKTGVKAKDERSISLRWYHILATIVVVSLAIVAVIKIIAHFDISLYGSKYTMKYADLGCTTSISGKASNEKNVDYRYAGINDGDYIGYNGVTSNEEDAFVQIISFSDTRITIKVRDHLSNGEWRDEKIRYGEEKTVLPHTVPDCMPGFSFTISK